MYRARPKGSPRLRECCGQCQAEMVSNSRNIIHQTWGPPFSQALYLFGEPVVYRGRRKSGTQVCSCSCLTLLTNLAYRILATWGPLLWRSFKDLPKILNHDRHFDWMSGKSTFFQSATHWTTLCSPGRVTGSTLTGT